jgi:hypothetical protein
MENRDLELRLARLEGKCRTWSRLAVTASFLILAMFILGIQWGSSKSAFAQDKSKSAAVQGNPTGGSPNWKLIRDNSEGNLERSVQRYLDCGWEPCGGVSVTCAPGGNFYYYQAVLKH